MAPPVSPSRRRRFRVYAETPVYRRNQLRSCDLQLGRVRPLWEATVSVRAVKGAVAPMIPGIEAMGADHLGYPVPWQLASTSGISGATLAEGATATGKVYFAVTSAKPAIMWCDMALPMADCLCCGADCACFTKP